jgi:hypothetical protein
MSAVKRSIATSSLIDDFPNYKGPQRCGPKFFLELAIGDQKPKTVVTLD